MVEMKLEELLPKQLLRNSLMNTLGIIQLLCSTREEKQGIILVLKEKKILYVV